MAKDNRFLTDEEVEVEIGQLKHSEYVNLAKKEQRIKNKRRQELYILRSLEKRGKVLASMGATLETLEDFI